ncbi:ribbon-helix-helix domain-containing protein [Luteithermobacter gelatinilyticus]|uniref:ribbon-helix-helix domain-containing protein n=1 Tax=Luteithermobacter gelatinilyticus TaxID=2582913 RepID=UPI001105D29C|nr:ribbon-helix-helix domain-containing protein [Luteithermobacter gelatinilyticus]|tara:strand:- start:24308 stop:24532 length:225 start_codon:yes stop_codon:yes gene_type:complete
MSDDDYELKKHSLRIAGHATSITLENIFWRELKRLARAKGQSVGELVSQIDAERRGNLSSAIRVYVLKKKLPPS